VHFIAFISWFFAALKTLITPSLKTAANAFTSAKLQIQTPSFIPKAIHFLWHCFSNDHCYFSTITPHIGF
jgi:hypothetical protein